MVRFDRVERAVHWTTAVLFGVLMATALPLFVPAVADHVGRRTLVAQVHLWAGLALPVPLLLAAGSRRGSRLRRDLRRINRWTPAEVRWLRTIGKDGGPVVDKFNPGQKLNALLVGSAAVVLLASGCVLQWFGAFPLDWRTGATFVHDLAAGVVTVLVLGHVVLAATHREALRSMVRGWVTVDWARRAAPAWLAEVREEPGTTQQGLPPGTPEGRASGAQAPGRRPPDAKGSVSS